MNKKIKNAMWGLAMLGAATGVAGSMSGCGQESEEARTQRIEQKYQKLAEQEVLEHPEHYHIETFANDFGTGVGDCGIIATKYSALGESARVRIKSPELFRQYQTAKDQYQARR